MFLLKEKVESLSLFLQERDESLRTTVQRVLTLNEDGTGNLDPTRYAVGENDTTNYRDTVLKILEYVV